MPCGHPPVAIDFVKVFHVSELFHGLVEHINTVTGGMPEPTSAVVGRLFSASAYAA